MTSVVTRARWAVATVFAVHGAASGSFAARIPWIAENLRLDEGSLGLALIMPAVGSLSTMPFAGRLVQRWGGRTATRVLIAAWSLAIGVLALAPNRWALMGMLLLAGAAAGTSDIAMNAEGVEVEQRLGRSIMSSLHGMWSVGGLIGSGIGAGRRIPGHQRAGEPRGRWACCSPSSASPPATGCCRPRRRPQPRTGRGSRCRAGRC